MFTMRFCIHFLLSFLLFHIHLARGALPRVNSEPETLVRTASPDPLSPKIINSPQDIEGKAETAAHLQSFRGQQPEETQATDDPTTEISSSPTYSQSSPRESIKSKEKYYDLNEGIEPESVFHENNLGRTVFIFWNWFKQLWLRLGDKFFDKFFKSELKRIYKTPSKKGLYDPVPLNRWDALDEREMKNEAAGLRKKLLEDFRSHPVFLQEDEKMVSSPNLVRLLKWFEDFKEPKDWTDSDYARMVTSLISKVQTEEKLDSEDVLTLQLIKYLAFFNPKAREVFKTKARGHDPGGEEVPVPSLWGKLITADLLFQDYPRQTLYPHRYHGLLEQVSMEWREEFRRRFIAGKLSSAAVQPPLGFRMREERHLRKIVGELQELQFITQWPIDGEGMYNNPERLVKKCIKFLAQQAHLPPEVNEDTNRLHPIKLVYTILNHVYEHSKGDSNTQILIERLIKRNVYCQKTIYAHVLLRQKFTPREFASLTLLEDIGFYDLLTPGMRKRLQYLAEREVVLNTSSELYRNEKEIIDYTKGKRELPRLVTPSSNYHLPAEKNLDEAVELIIKQFELNSQETKKFESGEISLEEHEALSLQQAMLVAELMKVVSTGPRIWRKVRQRLVEDVGLRVKIFSLLNTKATLILDDINVGKNEVSGFGLADFRHKMAKEITEYLKRSALISSLQSMVNDKLKRRLIDPEAADDITDFLSKLKNARLEVQWSALKWGLYDICPVEVSKESLKLIREYGFGRLPVDIHAKLANLMTHLTYGDSTKHINDMYYMAFQDVLDYRAFAFFQRTIPENANQEVDSERENLDGLTEQLRSKLRILQEEPEHTPFELVS
ncbi:hypothetical protein PGT21_000377 [Puccinia graminis f. sp. tritici]|uniref:Uncharacterized protein n=2 Tax=Puccinia graminis f. sp. tritici TaxID=56615 RepID=A0A5B0M8R3_PUCGR|nr:hypothetical protein PGT21_000377 [Puccinia graminis f. sp. tritici]KAA1074135.1 hypothetical protein PGTUg99_023697 [Puccinia graminis f. sp. tritici]